MARRRRSRVARALTGKGPGEIVLLKQTKGVRKSGKDFLRTEWAVKTDQQLFVHLDARMYVRELQLALADHCGEALKAQVSPETGQPIRPRSEVKLNAELRARFGSSVDNLRPDDTLVSSEKMANTWWCSKITGDRLAARGRIKPTTDGFKAQWVHFYLGSVATLNTRGGDPIAIRRRGPIIDLQSTEGLARQVIEDTVSELAADAMGAKVRTPKKIHVGATDRKSR